MQHRLRIVARSQGGWHDELFELAPPSGLQRRLGLIRPGNHNARECALLVIGVTWLPLVALSTIDGGATTLTPAIVAARYLIAAPLLILAETVCGGRLTAIARHFAIGNFIIERDHHRFERILVSTRTLLQWPIAEIVAWAAAYACSGWLLGPIGGHDLRGWSVAMRWNALVSLPVLLVLIFGWVWRFLLWCRFLLLVARLDLRLVASHPDRAAGLGFVGGSLRAFTLVALGLSTIAAGQAARVIIATHAFRWSHGQFGVALVAALVGLVTIPLFVFAPALARAYRFAALDYGELAVDVGRAFETKWVSRRSAKVRASGLQQPDFSATTDLYQIVSNVYAMRFVPVALKDLVLLFAVTTIPFLPLVLLVVPMSVIVGQLRDLLL